MYIKQIIIQGFKSYKEQTVIEPFSPKTNVIVGRNGSGKSNFFAAIRFVLSDAYTQMGREERQALLHEGSGSAVMSAYVEIIFDNSDDRFPTGKDELILRRTIGLKKDEYSLDRKNATKTDVMNLLESAGFSRSNPYYIVPQGRVTTLTNMKDAERLNLLKEVAGTQVYEARRTESLKIMADTNNKRAKIDESLEYIKERLAELEEEKEELRGYQEKDKERRCLEYAFYHREQTALVTALDEIENLRQDGIEGTDENREAFMEGERAISEVDDEIKQVNRQMELLKLERRQLEEDRRETSKAQAKIELDVKTFTAGLSATEQARAQQQQDLKAVKQDIAAKEAELGQILPEYTKRKAKETEVKQNLDIAEATQNRLYNKQGRSSQFKNKAERDKWLRGEIEQLNTALGEQKANRINADEEVKASQLRIQNLEEGIAGLRERLDGWGGSRQALSQEITTAKDALEKLTDQRKLLRREDDKLESVIADARREKERAESTLSHTMDGATSRGLATVRRLKQEHNIQGAYGTLAELIDVTETYRVAAEQTAGASLFHYVVDNDETATQLMDALHKQRGGRVTFMPLNQLRPKSTNLPKAADAVPLMSKITHEKRFEKAINQVFGKTIICPNLTVAAQYARSHNCTAITPEGDTANKKGALTGGFIDTRKSRLEAVRAVNTWRDEFESLRTRALEIRQEVERKDQEITVAMGGLQKQEQKLRQLDDSFEPLKSELRSKSSYLERERDQLEAHLRRREVVEKMLKDYSDNLGGFEAELATDFKKALSANEERQLEQLTTTVSDLRKQWNDLSKSRRELEGRKQLIEVDLRENLRMKLDQLNSQEIDSNASGGSGTLKESQRELKRIQRAIANVVAKLQENEAHIEQAEIRLGNLHKIKVQKEETQQEIARAIEKHQKRMEKSVAKKALLAASAAECAKNIRDLGVLPDEAFEKYSNMESKTLTARLKKVNEALKKYKHVNKKAFEQYNSFTSERDGLIRRRKELEDSQGSIQELVDVLDQRKDEAIERTFKQVSKEFASIFERLVPAGRGRLVIQRKTDQRAREDEDSDEEPRESVDNYTGVGISVSFNSKHDEQQRIQQLSGGQKSLCALALVFAIQQCDPAPFYLFDEIDANLDAQYRTAVAQMLEEISTQQGSQDGAGGGMSGQFICTTFRPEMLLVADKCYGVTFHNKTSGIDAVSRDEALRFVEGEAPK
ncbi:Structural maintenance of chromosomes protein [Venustampulla echinocandica]|uniref:Structural maintenance of chromosomes protein n=1 Tax=Venustampulla echinocandica TaxID=2656787 RepID=A0A370TPJ0_9HELO|nr:Structural maintenance of chromosomes protein [Venustampulla echinocandica]RDL37443.1 Structural maintenance of chromosomes protein [Venustampulla echinocandica]